MKPTSSKSLKNLNDYRNVKKSQEVMLAILHEYLPFVTFIAQKMAAKLPQHVDVEDLISSGKIGLIDAIKKFDTQRNIKFRTYAEIRIRGTIMDDLRSNDFVPRSVRGENKKFQRAASKLQGRLGRPPETQEMCAELELKLEDYFRLLDKIKAVSFYSIDESFGRVLEGQKSQIRPEDLGLTSDPQFMLESKFGQEQIHNYLLLLSEREQTVLSLYYFEELGLREIGLKLGIGPSRTSQLHSHALEKLKILALMDSSSFADFYGEENLQGRGVGLGAGVASKQF